ncbi:MULTISPECIES: hypothetical protein [Shouchella]|uniref:DUF5640 domain-containing protein n=2 Tax=Bacillaceae TaxID=186817 RepID=A0A060M285_9BACI|nr:MULTISPECIES: hypothetical protein [Bacillaceae]AIC96125.1 hypothetical protein BleG1_3578 [Shouchella lehensis G1]KQL58704.1 hypothetical protein AN965_01655 [Alkalicoccobacillus plakortidis]RQW18745.1 hypothetical protein EH196_17430 [Bacillus sp. C1-1]
MSKNHISKKSIVIGIFLSILLISVIALVFNKPPKNSALKGTYLSSDLPFATMVFDLDDNRTFYFYNESETDKGTYEYVSETTYKINSEKFNGQEMMFNGDDEVRIQIDHETYTFKKDSDLPTIINE